jgi:glutamyl-tRNA reductase
MSSTVPSTRFLLLGVNHRTAPVQVRERLAIPEHKLAEATEQLVKVAGVDEGMVLSTCNRVELLACAKNGSVNLRDFFREYLGAEPAEYEEHLYSLEQRDAMRHLFRVAASLDSMVVGEPQILGQVKESYAIARGVGAVRSNLNALVTRSFAVAKRVRSETAIGSSAVSVASVAVDLAKKIFGSLEGKTVYLVGAGKMSELAARHLMSQGAGMIFVANRTHDRALELASRFDGRAIKFEELYDTADRADILLVSTGAPHAIFRREHGERFLHRRKNRPMFFIDISVPRNVDPELNKLDGIFVYDIDDLQAVVSSNLAERHRESERAAQIIESELDRFITQLGSAEVTPTIVSLREHLETIRQAEIDRVRGRLGKLSPEQELAVEALTRGIVNKMLHAPISTLKSASREPATLTIEEAIRRMFGLRKGDQQSDFEK